MKNILEKLNNEKPLIHCFANAVTANDCANIVLAAGASPIMAECEAEAAEITSKARALCLNMGMINEAKAAAMIEAGKAANEKGIPVVFDPVGVGASRFRQNVASKILKEVKIDVIRANLSEIKTLFTGRSGGTVDTADSITSENLTEYVDLAKKIAGENDVILAITGEIDIISDKNTAYCIRNGNAMMKYVTGTGCQTSALTAVFMSAAPERPLQAVFNAVCAMGICGEIAHERMTPECGNATYRNFIIDAVYNLNAEEFERRAKYEIR